MTPEEIAAKIQNDFLRGQGRLTQLPGRAAPEVRKYYQTHKGYDFGVNEGTEVAPSFAGEAYDLGVVPGYGRRVLVKNPTTGESYYLSHLSNVAFNQPKYQFQAGQPIAYTGGRPGSYGAGQSTGSHIDIEMAGNNPNFQQLISQNSVYSNPRGKVNLKGLLGQIKQKYGSSMKAVSYNKAGLEALAKKRGGKVVRITV